MTTDSTFKLSTQIIEAGQQIQATGNELRKEELNTPLLPPTPPLSPVVQGAGWLVEQAGNGLRNLGFDEAEPDVTSSDESFTIEPPSLNPIDRLYPIFSQVPPSTFVIAGGQALQENGWTGTGQAIENAGHVMRSFGFDEAEEDSITGGGQTMDADEDDDIGAVFTIGALIAGGIAAAKASAAAAAAAAAAKATAAATAAALAAKGVAAGVTSVTATQVGAAIATGAVSGAASYGTAKAIEAATSDIDSDEGLAQPWLPEVGVDVLA